MKLQFASFISLAVLCGSVIGTPIPSEASEGGFIDSGLGTIGQLLGTAFSAVAPQAALQGAANGAGATLNSNIPAPAPQQCFIVNGQIVCTRDEASEDGFIDSGLNTIGQLLGTAFSAVAPQAALQGAANGAGATLNSNIPAPAPQQCFIFNNQIVCTRDEASEDGFVDDILGTAGQLLGTAYSAIAPQAALQGAANGADATLNSNIPAPAPQQCFFFNNQIVCTRDEASEDGFVDDILGTAGQLLGTAYKAVAPQAALQGAARGAGATLLPQPAAGLF